VTPEVVQTTGSLTCEVVVENVGTVPGTFTAVMWDGPSAAAQADIPLEGMGSYVWRFEYDVHDAGTHYLRVENLTQSILVEPWYADNPGLVQLVVRYGGSTSLSSSADIPIYRAAKLSEGNVASALFAIGVVSAVLSVLAVTSIFSREIHESKRRLGILRTIGAPNSAVRRMVFEQAFENGLAGSAIGMALGVIVADWLASSDRFLLFGHELRLTMDTGFLLLVFAAALAICVASALVSSEEAVRETAIGAIRGTEEDKAERIEVDELLE
jgi:putative ABC transport system permease protein